jgi:hypothetical protein
MKFCAPFVVSEIQNPCLILRGQCNDLCLFHIWGCSERLQKELATWNCWGAGGLGWKCLQGGGNIGEGRLYAVHLHTHTRTHTCTRTLFTQMRIQGLSWILLHLHVYILRPWKVHCVNWPWGGNLCECVWTLGAFLLPHDILVAIVQRSICDTQKTL